jgi:hypothetical protein
MPSPGCWQASKPITCGVREPRPQPGYPANRSWRASATRNRSGRGWRPDPVGLLNRLPQLKGKSGYAGRRGEPGTAGDDVKAGVAAQRAGGIEGREKRGAGFGPLSCLGEYDEGGEGRRGQVSGRGEGVAGQRERGVDVTGLGESPRHCGTGLAALVGLVARGENGLRVLDRSGRVDDGEGAGGVEEESRIDLDEPDRRQGQEALFHEGGEVAVAAEARPRRGECAESGGERRQ